MAAGDITLVDTQLFSAGAGLRGVVPIHLQGNIYAIVGGVPWDQGKIYTYEISPAGGITNIEIDSWAPDALYCPCFSAAKVTDNIIAVTYQETASGPAFIRTYKISDAGVIDTTWDETKEIACCASRGIYIGGKTGDYFLLSWTNFNSGGAEVERFWLGTLKIESDGIIQNLIQETSYGDSACNPGIVTHLAGRWYATSRQPSPTLTEISTVLIDSADGTFELGPDGWVDVTGDNGGFHAFFKNGNNQIWGILTDSVIGNCLQGFEFDAARNITQGTARLVLEAQAMWGASGFAHNSSVLVAGYRLNLYNGYIKTIEVVDIDTTPVVLDTYVPAGDEKETVRVFKIDYDTFGAVTMDGSDNAVLTTYDDELLRPARAHNELMMGVGP